MIWRTLTDGHRAVRVNLSAFVPMDVLADAVGKKTLNRHPAPFNKREQGRARRTERRFVRQHKEAHRAV